MKKILLLTTCTILLSASIIGCSNKTDNSSSSTTSTESSASIDTISNSTDSPATDSTNTDNSTTDSSAQSDSTSQTFTVEDLAQYNGQNGNPAYVAINGTVYDVSNSKEWKNGTHKSGIVAGQDLTDRLGDSPHGDSVLGDLPVIGTLEP